MKARRISDVVERVVAWHNRHPLARRITKAQVQGVGVVALPFALQRRPGERTGDRHGRRDPVLSEPTEVAEGAAASVPDVGPEAARRHDAAGLPDLADTHAPVDLPVLSEVAAAEAGTAPTPGWRRPWQVFAGLLAGLPTLKRLRVPWPRRGGPASSDADRRPLTPIFGDEWTFRLPAAGLGRWVGRHGVYPLEGYGHWPMRQVDADIPLARRADARGLEGRTVRHLLTAVIDVDGRRVRLLIAPGDNLARAPVHGRRVWSPRRAAGVATGALALGVAGVVGLRSILGLGAGHGTGPEAMASAASGAVASLPASGPVSGPVSGPASGAAAEQATVLAHTGSSVAAPAAASGPSAGGPTAVATSPEGGPEALAPHGGGRPEHPAGPPPHVSPTVMARSDGAAPLARIRPHLTEDERRQARLQAESLRPGTTGAAAAAGASAPAALLGPGPVYALVTPLARNRDDALAQQVLLQGLKAQTPTLVPTQLDVMASQGRWRVVWWPHPRQQEAEALLKEARARGLKVELIVF